jgi:hypothetical protein
VVGPAAVYALLIAVIKMKVTVKLKGDGSSVYRP